MLSLEHEAIREVVRWFPEAMRELIEAVVGVELAVLPARTEDADLSTMGPVELRADRLLVYGTPPQYGLVVEIQRSPDEGKRHTWPLYCASAHAQLRCAVWVVVIAPDRKVAAWAARPIETFQPGTGFAPVVVGPDEIPRITDPDRASASPGLAMLSAIVHGHEPGGDEVAVAAVDGLASVEPERATLCLQILQALLDDVVFAALEAHMELRNFPYRIPFARKAYEQGREEGREQGREQGREEGREEGREQGREEGREQGLRATRNAILRLFEARFGVAPAAVRARIVSCSEFEVLERWLERVAGAADEPAARAAFEG